MWLVDRLQRETLFEDVVEFGIDPLLLDPVILIGNFAVIIVICLAFALWGQVSAMNLEHAAPLTLEDFFEEVLLDVRGISIALVRLSQVFFFVKNFNETLGQLAVALLLS